MRLRRVARPIRVTITMIIVLALSSLGFIAGRFFQPPDLSSLNQSTEPIQVWSTVENRVVDDRQSYAAVVKAGATTPVPAQSIIEPAVVVRQGLEVGAVARAGSLAGVVSGQPYFLLPTPLPLYRNLKKGDAGDDVLSLQRSMNTAGFPVLESGVVDSELLFQVEKLFASDGYNLPTSADDVLKSDETSEIEPPSPRLSQAGQLPPFIPYRQLLPIPATGGTVVSSLPVGSILTGDSPLISLRVSENYVEFIADVTHVTSLSVGQELTLRIGTTETKGRIEAIDEFRDGKDGQKSGRPVRLIPVDSTARPTLTENLSLTVLSDGGASTGLAVPLGAIRQDASGTYLEKLAEDSTTVRTAVTVLKSGGGYASVAGDIGLGDEVLIS